VHACATDTRPWDRRLVSALRGRGRPAERFLRTVTSYPRWVDFYLDATHLRQRTREIQPFNLTAAVRAFYQLYADKHGKPRRADKTPAYVLHMQRGPVPFIEGQHAVVEQVRAAISGVFWS
jgi:hypothetical protein